jgi:hypothetical protein
VKNLFRISEYQESLLFGQLNEKVEMQRALKYSLVYLAPFHAQKVPFILLEPHPVFGLLPFFRPQSSHDLRVRGGLPFPVHVNDAGYEFDKLCRLTVRFPQYPAYFI